MLCVAIYVCLVSESHKRKREEELAAQLSDTKDQLIESERTLIERERALNERQQQLFEEREKSQ